ncbi:hypothetical protein JNUCC0626_07965 [Lentzea sp. JNUCC 0626]|uniref:hypothetical protein n=1 Tax=Lentzea sp. JNUCC 0626 TaxID=3367513 RepID=UPI003747B383
MACNEVIGEDGSLEEASIYQESYGTLRPLPEEIREHTAQFFAKAKRLDVGHVLDHPNGTRQLQKSRHTKGFRASGPSSTGAATVNAPVTSCCPFARHVTSPGHPLLFNSPSLPYRPRSTGGTTSGCSRPCGHQSTTWRWC